MKLFPKRHNTHDAPEKGQDSIPVSVVDEIDNADAIVTFYDHSAPNVTSDDEGLYYDLMIPGAPEMGGWFCDDDHVA